MKRIKKLFYILMIFIILMAMQGCGSIQISAKEVRVELGGEASKEIADYIFVEDKYREEVEQEAFLDLSEVDVHTVGEYRAAVVYKGEKVTIPVIVEDTTPPEIWLKDTGFKDGDQVWAGELVYARDESETDISVSVNGSYGGNFVVYPGMKLKVEATDAYGNRAVKEMVPYIRKKEVEGAADGNRVIEIGAWGYPIEEMYYANEEAYLALKEAYGEIEWKSEFEIGNIEEYDFYKGKFRELLLNEKPYYDEERDEEIFLKDYNSTYPDLSSAAIDYYFFDMDQDGTPELGITTVHFILFIKYDRETDRFLLWKEYESTYYELNGSRTVRHDHTSVANRLEYSFYKLDENGNEIYAVGFMICAYVDEEIDDFREVYLIGFPRYYMNEDRQMEIPKDIKKQGYSYYDCYYFRVTGEQYDELTRRYFEAADAADIEIKEITYTYDEMIN